MENISLVSTELKKQNLKFGRKWIEITFITVANMQFLYITNNFNLPFAECGEFKYMPRHITFEVIFSQLF